jgi:iron-sulfur cluster repair protein YtfE (RIC family)
METTDVPLADAMLKAHGALKRDLQEVSQALHSSEPAIPRQFQDRLVALQKHVAEHFRFEEQNGYMPEVLKRKPNLDRDVAKLRSDHRLLAETLSQLITEARGKVIADEAWSRRLKAWIAEVERHEILENDLIQDAFNLDISAED